MGCAGWQERKALAANENQSYNSEMFPADEEILKELRASVKLEFKFKKSKASKESQVLCESRGFGSCA